MCLYIRVIRVKIRAKEWAKLKVISKSRKSRLGRDEPHISYGQTHFYFLYVKWGRVRLNVILCNFFTFKTNTFSIIKTNIVSFLFSFFCYLFSFYYSGIATSFRLHQFQTFQNTNETYKYKFNPLKQILFLSSFPALLILIITISIPAPTKTHSHRQKHTKTASTA